jgi:hypothetical protein
MDWALSHRERPRVNRKKEKEKMKAHWSKKLLLAMLLALLLLLGLAASASADDVCTMVVQMPDKLQQAGATVDIDHGPQDLKHGDPFTAPQGTNVRWRLTVNGFNSGWKTKQVDCSDLVVAPADWCEMHIDLGGLQGDSTAKVDIDHGPQNLVHFNTVTLPT